MTPITQFPRVMKGTFDLPTKRLSAAARVYLKLGAFTDIGGAVIECESGEDEWR